MKNRILSAIILLSGVLHSLSGFATQTFVQATNGGNSSGASSSVSNAATTTTGNLLFVFFGEQRNCNNGMTGSNALGNTPTDTAGDTFTPIIPAHTTAYAAGINLDSAGSGYAGVISCTISGGGATTNATCAATESGGAIATLDLQTAGAGYTSPATVTITGSQGGSGATAHITAYGIGNSSTECTMAWYAKNITGATNNQVTITHDNAVQYHWVTVEEWSGLSTIAPYDTEADAVTSGTSITSSAFSTAQAHETAICGTRVEALTQTWAPGTGYTNPANADPGGTNDFITSEYQPFTTAQSGATASISSGSSADREIICGLFKEAAAATTNSLPVIY